MIGPILDGRLDCLLDDWRLDGDAVLTAGLELAVAGEDGGNVAGGVEVHRRGHVDRVK